MAMQLYIIPTYKCNLTCNNCYSKKYNEYFKQYLSWEGFVNVYNFFKNRVNTIAFIGGEPTQWKFINEAIMFLRNKDKKVLLFSNGTKITNIMPDYLVLNANNLFSNKHSSIILENLNIYKKNKVKTKLRFNINEIFTESRISEAIRLSKIYANSVSISLMYPISEIKDIGEKIFNLAKGLVKESITVRVSRATPLCLFTQEQKTYLMENCKLTGKCSLPTNSIVINPDGLTIQPCVELMVTKQLNDLGKKSPRALFSQEVKNLKNKTNNSCADCAFFKSKECCGGCLAYK